MSEVISKYLNIIGINFPSNDEELILFNSIHKDYSSKTHQEGIDPLKILKEIKEEEVQKKKRSGQFYYKRSVLAAEIIYQLQGDNYLGHVKLHKLLYLCQNIFNMSLPANFLKQAMGPYDPRLMRSIDIQLKRNEWFDFKKGEFPKYKPMNKVGGHTEWFGKYFNEDKEKIHQLINLFKKFNTSQIELVSTIYACWLDGIQNNSIINNSFLITKLYSWNDSKKKFKEEQIVNAIKWMKENKIYPLKK